MSKDSIRALAMLPEAAARVIKAASDSEESGRKLRARLRRERMISQTFAGAVVPPQPQIDMPLEWADDEVTSNVHLPYKKADGR